MTNEERLLITIEKLLQQNREDPEFIKELCINAITEYGDEKYSDGYGVSVKHGTAGGF